MAISICLYSWDKLFHAFEELITGPLMTDLLADPIVKFAFTLLVPDAYAASKAHAYRESARVSAKYTAILIQK